MEKDFEYYLENKNTLVKRFGKGFLIIQNKSVIEKVANFMEAVKFIEHKKGDFLVQEVALEKDGQTALFSN